MRSLRLKFSFFRSLRCWDRVRYPLDMVGNPWGGACPVTPSPQERGAAAPRHEASGRGLRGYGDMAGWLVLSWGPGTGLTALGAGAQRTFLFYLREIFAESLTEEHAA